MLGFIVKSAVHKSHPYQEETTLKSSTKLFIGITLLACQQILAAQTIVEHGTSSQYQLGPSGKLRYSEDAKGNRIPDFSYVGYHSGKRPSQPSPSRSRSPKVPAMTPNASKTRSINSEPFPKTKMACVAHSCSSAVFTASRAG